MACSFKGVYHVVMPSVVQLLNVPYMFLLEYLAKGDVEWTLDSRGMGFMLILK
jgi:hypothetical protein